MTDEQKVSAAMTYGATYDLCTGEQPRRHLSALVSECGRRGDLLRKWEEWARHHYPDHAAGLIAETRERLTEDE